MDGFRRMAGDTPVLSSESHTYPGDLFLAACHADPTLLSASYPQQQRRNGAPKHIHPNARGLTHPSTCAPARLVSFHFLSSLSFYSISHRQPTSPRVNNLGSLTSLYTPIYLSSKSQKQESASNNHYARRKTRARVG